MIQYFPNILFSFILSFFVESRFEESDMKAYWQPPGYVFGIVWPILYLLFGYINYLSTLVFRSTKNNIILNQSYIEAYLQTAWLFVTSRGESERSLNQYVLGLIILGISVGYAYLIRLPTFYFLARPLLYLYIPYMMWICFAFILNAQLVHKSLTSQIDTSGS